MDQPQRTRAFNGALHGEPSGAVVMVMVVMMSMLFLMPQLFTKKCIVCGHLFAEFTDKIPEWTVETHQY
jgi:hypothetical protein